MAPRRSPSGFMLRAAPAPAPSGPADSSWMALLASTTLGVDGSTVRALVRASSSEIDEAAEYRLVVQSYDGSMRDGARPVGSIQRVVSGTDLRRGVQVSLVELRALAATRADTSKGLVVAWLETGKADVELDARASRPPAGCLYGAARRTAGNSRVEISLSRKLKLAA